MELRLGYKSIPPKTGTLSASLSGHRSFVKSKIQLEVRKAKIRGLRAEGETRILAFRAF